MCRNLIRTRPWSCSCPALSESFFLCNSEVIFLPFWFRKDSSSCTFSVDENTSCFMNTGTTSVVTTSSQKLWFAKLTPKLGSDSILLVNLISWIIIRAYPRLLAHLIDFPIIPTLIYTSRLDSISCLIVLRIIVTRTRFRPKLEKVDRRLGLPQNGFDRSNANITTWFPKSSRNIVRPQIYKLIFRVFVSSMNSIPHLSFVLGCH